MSMGLVAERNGLDISGAQVAVVVEDAAGPVNRFASFTLTVTLPRKFSEADQNKLLKAAELCHVRNSLRPEIAVNVKLVVPA